MWLSFQKYPITRGIFFRKTVHVLEVWLYLTEDEKDTIEASGLHMPLFYEEENVHDKTQFIRLDFFSDNSGPRTLDFASAFEAHSAANEIRQTVESISGAIQAYDAGEITAEECYQL